MFLTKDDVFKHQHYIIITRSGIDKIQALENIHIKYDVIKCEPNFSVVQATAIKGTNTIQTFGSALKGSTYQDGNTNSWYVMEMAEKREKRIQLIRQSIEKKTKRNTHTDKIIRAS